MGAPLVAKYSIDEWDAKGNHVQNLAKLDNLDMARSAYETAVKLFPNANLTLRHWTRIVQERKPLAPR